MTKHNALRMLGRSGNPTLGDATFAGFETTGAKTMSLQGTVNKVGILLALVIGGALFTWNQFYSTGSVGFLMPVGLFGGMIFAVITMFRPNLAMYTAPIYAILQGLFLGGISAAFESMYPGIVIQATGLTFGTLASLLVLYKTGVIKPTENFRLMVVSATMGIAVLYAISFVMSMFGSGIGFIHSNGLFGIGFSLFVVGIAAMNLVLDFDFIEDGAERGAPRYMEWFGAFALMVTLIWLYLEMLRLLAKIRSR